MDKYFNQIARNTNIKMMSQNNGASWFINNMLQVVFVKTL